MPRILLTCLLLFPTLGTLAQQSSRGGRFPEYARCNVKEISRYQISYSDTLPNDTLCLVRQEFDREGFMLREQFPGTRSRSVTYTFSYNSKGFLSDIDTSGMTGLGWGSSGPDTAYSTETKIYQHFDTVSRVIRSIFTNLADLSVYETLYAYDSLGGLASEQTISTYRQPVSISTNKTEYHYTDDGLLEDISNYNEHGRLSSKVLSVYRRKK
jgi:hypothetical protein